MEKPRFEKTGQNRAGYPIYERIKEPRPSEDRELSEDDPTEPNLSPKQRHSLKLALALVGAMIPNPAGKQTYDPHTDSVSIDSRQPIESVESDPSGTVDRAEETEETGGTEAREGSEAPAGDYEHIRAVHQTKFRLPHDAVQMVSTDNRLVGEPISFNENNLGLEPGYQGPVNDASIATEGIAGQWLEAAREYVQEQYPETEIARLVHANEEFRKVYDPDRFPELVAQIDAGEVETIEDITAYFIEQPFAGADGLDRYEYALEHVTFRDEDLVIPTESGEVVRRAVPPAVQDFFRSVLPGLAAHESMFRDDLVSNADAEGALQITPDEWNRVRDKGDAVAVDTNFATQVDKWGEIMSDHYNSMYERIDDSLLDTLHAQFADEAAFDRELMARLALLSYNVGPAGVTDLVEAYVSLTSPEDMPSGPDVFAAITAFGKSVTEDTHGPEFAALYEVGPEADSYVPAAEAKALALAERFGNPGSIPE